MATFEQLTFNGTFRSYQQQILENATTHLEDKKIHIVAAPGSGKTILGLELLCRIGEPALILSPSITIRHQWGERFEQNFLTPTQPIDDFISYDITKPKLITSITYQALHAAINNKTPDNILPIADSDETEVDELQIDYGLIDFFKIIEQTGIKTICLDEAHHLKNEWQKALEFFIEKMKLSVTIVSLTATPPFDSTPQEWQRYLSVCGEIDDEIFVPQLVANKSLCPHQDYIYFNYPSQTETETLKQYQDNAMSQIEKLLATPLIQNCVDAFGLLTAFEQKADIILETPEPFLAILSILKYQEVKIPKRLLRLLSPSRKTPPFNLHFITIALQFILDNPDFFLEKNTAKLRSTLMESGLLHQKKVCLESTPSINKSLISSLGKLESITKIVEHEKKCLGKDLKMLILTDYIKKDLIPVIGTKTPLKSMGTVPIFETLRRSDPTTTLGILSGSLVILPTILTPLIHSLTTDAQISVKILNIPQTEYSSYEISGGSKHKVSIITKLFSDGHIQVLIGTKSLLGEGWDAPVINTLILASFVGSYMLSNQMRGRAIRIDPNNREKTANIWHLVTVDPLRSRKAKFFRALQVIKRDKMDGEDYELLEKRFQTFLAPAYYESYISNGIERTGISQHAPTKENITNLNQEMLALSENREALREQWDVILKVNEGEREPEILDIVEIPKRRGYLSRSAVFISLLQYSSIYGAFQVYTQIFGRTLMRIDLSSIFVILFLISTLIFAASLRSLLAAFSPYKAIYKISNSLLLTLQDMNVIKSERACVKIEYDEIHTHFRCALEKATPHEKHVFAEAMKELLSVIENPRYIIIQQSKFFFIPYSIFSNSFTCPTIIGTNKLHVERFTNYLSQRPLSFRCLYTRTIEGRKTLLKVRRKSYINRNFIHIYGKKIFNSKWS